MTILSGVNKERLTVTLDIELINWVDKKVKNNDNIPSRSFLINQCIRDTKKRMDKK